MNICKIKTIFEKYIILFSAMDIYSTNKEKILNLLKTKGLIKINCFNKALDIFQDFKNILHETSGDINDEMPNIRSLKMDYRDRGKFEAQLQFGDDILIFNMHTDIFQFPDTHPVCKTPYALQDDNNTLCAVVNVYNFLSNSFKYNRESDEGYLVARIFVNHEGYYFVEGKNLEQHSYDIFGTKVISEEILVDIIQSLVLYTLDFDLLVPDYNAVKVIDSDMINNRIDNSKADTGKRLYSEFDISDIKR